MSQPAAPPTASSLCRCGQCGYRLQGLPSVGQCPECGAPYDASRIILLGWSRGSHGSIWNSRGLTLFGFGLLFLMNLNPMNLAGIISGVMTLDSRASVSAMYLLGIIAIVFVLRRDRPQSETTRILLSLDGFAQDDQLKRSSLSCILLPAMMILWFLIIANMNPQVSFSNPWILALVLLVLMLVLLDRSRVRNEPGPLTPWNRASRVDIKYECGNRFHLRIDKAGRLFSWDKVNADLDLTHEQAEELRAHLARWRQT